MERLIFNRRIGSRGDKARYHEIVEHNGRKFRIISDIRKGLFEADMARHDSTLSILLADGTWGPVVTAADLNINLRLTSAMDIGYDLYYDRVHAAFEDYIKKVYS